MTRAKLALSHVLCKYECDSFAFGMHEARDIRK